MFRKVWYYIGNERAMLFFSFCNRAIGTSRLSYIGYYDVVLGDVDGRDMSPGYFVGSREISSALNRSTFLITRPRSTYTAITHLPSQLVSQENRFATLFSSSIRAPLAQIHMTIFSNHNTGFYKPQTSKISIMIYVWSMREMNYWYPVRLKLVWIDSSHLWFVF